MIKIKSIGVGYGNENVINNLTCSFSTGEFCALIGPNGAGKSTLLKSILGILPLRTGEILIKDKSAALWKRKELARVLTLIPQEINLQYDFRVIDLIMMGRYPYLDYFRNYSAEDREITKRVMKEMDLISFSEKYYSQLSGGEKKRVAIARALVQETEIILIDEALAELDINHQLELMEILAAINRKQKKLILLVSHDINLAADYCQRLIMLKNGEIIGDGSISEVFSEENLEKLYDRRLRVITNPLSKNPNIIFPGLHE
ncbi:MAG: ABC transporter ATP-binding protein [Candidatus Cloacimonetes bacterium]|nr:ABC transporter ATP-binding protein [Candidatus Cloacimonadota bacterium]